MTARQSAMRRNAGSNRFAVSRKASATNGPSWDSYGFGTEQRHAEPFDAPHRSEGYEDGPGHAD